MRVIFLITLVIILIIGITKSVNFTKKYINPPVVISYTTNIVTANTIGMLAQVVSNIEKEKEEYRLGVYYGSRSFLQLINTGKKNLNDDEIYNNSLIIRKQVEGEKK